MVLRTMTVEQAFFEEWNKLLKENLELNIKMLKSGLDHTDYMYYVGKVQEQERIIQETKELYSKFYPL